MTGSGDEKFDKAPRTSINETERAGLLRLSADSLTVLANLPFLSKFERKVILGRERQSLLCPQRRTNRKQSLARRQDRSIPDTTLLDLELLHLELPTQSCSIVCSTEYSSFVRVDVLGDLVVVSENRFDGCLNEWDSGVSTVEDKGVDLVEGEVGGFESCGDGRRESGLGIANDGF
jgi:hypothetical protein